MLRLPTSSAFLVTFVIATSLVAAPQKKPGQRKPTADEPSATNPTIQVQPIDPSRSLPKFFVGSPIELIYAMFVGGPPRGEFETSAEYEKRRAEFLSVGVYPFVLAEVSIAYDADAGHFAIRVPSKRVRAANGNATSSAFEAAMVLPDDSTAWLREVSAVADEASIATYNVLLLNWRQDETKITVSMARDKARDTKPFLRVLAMVRLGPTAAHWVMTQTIGDYVSKNPIYQLHLAKDASELAGRYELALAGELESIRVYDYRTGEVVAKIVPDAAHESSVSLAATPLLDRPVKMLLALAEYPDVARRARVAGIVIAEVTVALDGSVKSVKILKPLPFGLDNAVAKAIEASSFGPAIRGGFAVDETFQVTYKFDLEAGNGVPAPWPKP